MRSAEDQAKIDTIREEIDGILAGYAPQQVSAADQASLKDAYAQLDALREDKDTSAVDALHQELQDLTKVIGHATPTTEQQAGIDDLKAQIDDLNAPTEAEQTLLDQIAAIHESYAPKNLSEADTTRLAELRSELQELLPSGDGAKDDGALRLGDLLDHAPGGHGHGAGHAPIHGGGVDLDKLVASDSTAIV